MAMTSNQIISVSEAASIIGCSERHVRALVDRAKLKGEKLSERVIVIDRKSAEGYAKIPQSVGRPRGSKKN